MRVDNDAAQYTKAAALIQDQVPASVTQHLRVELVAAQERNS